MAKRQWTPGQRKEHGKKVKRAWGVPAAVVRLIRNKKK